MLSLWLVRPAKALSAVKIASRYCCWATMENKSLYEILGVQRSATASEIKKAYFKLALAVHPDRNAGDSDATEKFQNLQRVYSILSDEKKRTLYDNTGSIEDAEVSRSFEELYDYYRNLYQKVTESNIAEFEKSYRGSKEETDDLKDLYSKYKGNMRMVFEYLLCSQVEADSFRFRNIIDKLIDEGELERYKAYSKWAKKVQKPPSNKGKKRPLDDASRVPDSLIMAIRSRVPQKQTSADDIMESYLRFKGDMKMVLFDMNVSTPAERAHVLTQVQDLIDSGQVSELKKFKAWKKAAASAKGSRDQKEN